MGFVEGPAQLGWTIKVGEAVRRIGSLREVRSFIGELYGPDLHARRIDALTGAAIRVMAAAAASLAVAMIGQAPAQARGLVTKRKRCVGDIWRRVSAM